MNLKKQAKSVQKAGFKNSGQDSVLAHITPKEEGLLKLFGGSGRTDPQTGLKHYDEGDGGETPGGFGGGFGDGGLGGDAPGGYGGWGDGGLGGLGDGYGGVGSGGDYGGNYGAGAPGEGFGGYGGWGDSGDLGGDLSFEGPVSYDDSFTTGDFAMSPGDFSSNFGDYVGAHEGGISGSSPTGTEGDFLSKLTKFTKNLMAKKAIGALTQTNPVLGTIANIVAPVAMNQNTTTPVGQQIAGSMVNTMMGPLAAIPGIANMFGANIPSIGSSIANANLDYKGLPEGASGYGASTTGQTGTNGQGMNWGNTLGGLAGLYGMYRNYSDAGKGVNSLQNMFSQNSPYAQQLRQQLSRRDAAAGRRSQYGPREVELQAKLAQMAAGVAPHIMQGRQNQFQNQMQMMQQLGALYKMGAFNGLGSMFSGMFGGSGSTDYVPSSSDLGSIYSGDAYGEWGG